MILAVRHQTVPNFSAFRQRAMVIDGDIRDADTLDDLCMLAVARQIKYSGLRMAQSCGQNNCNEHRVSAKFLRIVVLPENEIERRGVTESLDAKPARIVSAGSGLMD